MTCMQVIVGAKCNLHYPIMIVWIALKNSIVFANGGVIDISNLLNYNLLYNLIPFGYGYHIHLISKFLVVDGAQ
jgi:hypothetical protein